MMQRDGLIARRRSKPREVLKRPDWLDEVEQMASADDRWRFKGWLGSPSRGNPNAGATARRIDIACRDEEGVVRYRPSPA